MGQWTLIRMWMILGVMTMSLFTIIYLTIILEIILELVIEGKISNPIKVFTDRFKFV